MQTKKGFILVYTILVGIICLIMMMYIFDIQVGEMKYSISAKKYILKEDYYQKNKEYLITLFSEVIDVNSDQIKKEGVSGFFHNFESNIVMYEESKVRYSNITSEFIFTTPFEDRINRNDYFKLEPSGDSFKIIFTRTNYTDK
jgi:hypothetical protein